MKITDASSYIGTSPTNLKRLVTRGELAQPLIRGGERLWDIRDLDEHAESLKRDGMPVANDWSGHAI
jgi:hypothetical protein